MKKKLFSLFLVFSLIYLSFVPRLVYANTFVASTPVMSNGAKAIIGAITPFAPEVALVAVACISAGVIFENREQIAVIGGGIYNKMVASGIAVTTSATTGALSLGNTALNFINTQIASLKTSQNITLDYSMPSTATIYTNPWSFVGMAVVQGAIYHWYDNNGSLRTFNVNLNTEKIGMPIQYLIDSYSGYRVLDFGGYQYKADETREVGLDYPVGSTGSICVDIPSAVTSTPSVTAPYPVDTALNIPSDTSITGDSTATANPTTTWEDTLIGENDWTKPFAQSIPIDVPIDTTGTGVLAPTDYGIPLTKAIDFTPLKGFDLTGKFPFSIPWDIKNSITTLVAPSVAPKFDIDMTKWKGGTHYIIDFSMFDKLATILRWGMLMIFNIGLILKTRSIIRG